MISLLTHNIITRFGILESLVFDNATYISSLKLIDFALDKRIKLKFVSNYYLQGNDPTKSTHKNLMKILKKLVDDHQQNWHNA